LQKIKSAYNKENRITKPLLLVLFLLVFCINLHANDVVALHPFRSTPDDADEVIEIANDFYDIIMRAIPNVTGNYSAFPIDLTRLPPDVPEGGFPPFICPSPSITRGSDFALTGEVSIDYDFPGNFRLRVYLWRMDGARLLGSDELSAASREDAERIMPNFLEWVFSWVVSADPMIIYIDGDGRHIDSMSLGTRGSGDLFAGILDPHWLYLGFHGGGGYSVWAYARNPVQLDDGVNEMVPFFNLNLGLRLSTDLMRYLRIRTELNISMDSGAVEGGYFSYLHLTVPLMAQFVLQYSLTEFGIYGGIDTVFPLHNASDDINRNFNYKPVFPGFLFGINLGLNLGPGTLFFDTRFNYDGRWGRSYYYEEVYYRISNRFQIGYEWGFFPK